MRTAPRSASSGDRKSTRLNSSHLVISYAVFCLKNKNAVQLLGDIPGGITGRPVLLVDDIVDTGRSIAYAAAQLRGRGVSDLWICVFLDKPQHRQNQNSFPTRRSSD